MKYLILCALVATAVAAWPATTEGPGANEGLPFGNFPGPNFSNWFKPGNLFNNLFNRKPAAGVTTEGPAARQYSPYDPYYGQQQHPYSDPNAPVFPAQFQMFQYFGRENRTETTTQYWQNPYYNNAPPS